MSIFRPWIITFLLALAVSITAGCVDLTPCQRGDEGCACRATPTSVGDPPRCDAAADGVSVCAAGTCVVQRTYDQPTVCYDACAYRQNGQCDDGGPGSDFDDCGRGSDCTDCGVRPNPCAGTAMPIFCPQTPDNCWAANTDCLTVRTCNALLPAMRGPIACTAGQAVDCMAVGGPKCVTTNPCATAGLAKCLNENSCVAPYIDCNSLTTCNGNTVGCYQGETVVCMAGQAPACMP